MTDDYVPAPPASTDAFEPAAGPGPGLDARISLAAAGLLKHQRDDGHFCFELEADATIPAEYVLLLHWLGEENRELEAKIAAYLRRIQGEHGGWPLFTDGDFDMSASVKAYFALKMIGEPLDAPHMARARTAILQRGGAANANVFTRILLALYGQIPWRGVPVMPVEIMALPRWFPFHLSKVSYWARTVIVPLLVLQALKPVAANPRGIGVAELFLVPPDEVTHWPKGPHSVAPWSQVFGTIDRALRLAEPRFPKTSRERAIAKAVAFVDKRLNGESGLGAIYPAMANTVMMYEALGVPRDDPRVATARRAIDGLLVVGETEAYCQPCLSPVWDTALAAHALIETGGEAGPHAKAALDWLEPLQILDHKGDWAEIRPDVRPGGWGEDGLSYKMDYRAYEPSPSSASQTAWALLGLMAAGRVDDPAVARGIAYLSATQQGDGLWTDCLFNAVGFPRVFYLKYHGYAKFFPLWAMARYRNLRQSNSRRVSAGM